MAQTADPLPSRSLSRQAAGLLVEMKRLLLRYEVPIKLNASDAIERMLAISAKIGDADVQDCRERLLHATLPLDRLYLLKHTEDVITCDRCGDVLRAFVSGSATVERPEMVHCICGKQLQVALEPRKHVRKMTNLPGIFLYDSDREQTGEMTVEDISYGGISMRIDEPHSLVRDDRLLVVFNLDDQVRTPVSEPVRVRHVRGQQLGIQFVTTQTRNKALTQYISF